MLAMLGYFALVVSSLLYHRAILAIATATATAVTCQKNHCRWPSCKILAP